MAIASTKLVAKKGASFVTTITVSDDDGTPVDLAGVTAIRFQARPEYTSATAVLSLSVGAGITIAAPTTLGQFTIRATPAQMAITARDYVYDVDITGLFVATDTLPILTGALEVLPSAIS